MHPALTIVFIFGSLQSLNGFSSKTNSRLNFFDIDLLRYAAEDKSGNVMVSPASIKSRLAMILEGARGITADQIKIALRLPLNRDDFREELNLFLKAIQENTSSVSLEKANGLFFSKKLHLKKDYEMMVRDVYFSDVNKLDFNKPKATANAINGWVHNKTKGLIPPIVEQDQVKNQPVRPISTLDKPIPSHLDSTSRKSISSSSANQWMVKHPIPAKPNFVRKRRSPSTKKSDGSAYLKIQKYFGFSPEIPKRPFVTTRRPPSVDRT